MITLKTIYQLHPQFHRQIFRVRIACFEQDFLIVLNLIRCKVTLHAKFYSHLSPWFPGLSCSWVISCVSIKCQVCLVSFPLLSPSLSSSLSVKMDHQHHRQETTTSIASSSSSSDKKVDLSSPASTPSAVAVTDVKHDEKHMEQGYMFDKMGAEEATEYEPAEIQDGAESGSTKPKPSIYARYRKFFQ